MIEKFFYGNQLLAIIIRSTFTSEGIEFFTPDSFSQQLGYMNRPKGYIVAPHIHNPVERKVTLTQEVLYIRSGVVKVDFYDNDQNYIESRLLHKGDVILLAAGGHGLEMMENAEIIEVKQGPYCCDQDKKIFNNYLQKIT